MFKIFIFLLFILSSLNANTVDCQSFCEQGTEQLIQKRTYTTFIGDASAPCAPGIFSVCIERWHTRGIYEPTWLSYKATENTTNSVCIIDPPVIENNISYSPVKKITELSNVYYEEDVIAANFFFPDVLYTIYQYPVYGDYNETTYACIPKCTDTDFPKIAKNQIEAFRWTTTQDLSDQCTIIPNSEKQQREVNCETEFRCLVRGCEKEENQEVSSYVTPRDQAFHEDIVISGTTFSLHYSSNNIERNQNKTIGYGWSLSNYATLTNNKLYLGSGNLWTVEPTQEANLTVVKIGSNEMLFDANGKHIKTRALYTKEIKTTFIYDSEENLIRIINMYGEITTIHRDFNGIVTSIIAPEGQTTYLNIDANGDLLEVQYEDTSSYTFEYQDHLMILEREPNGNTFLHFFDEKGKVIKVIDAEQGEWDFATSSDSTSGTHTVTRASGDIITYKNHFLENGILKTEKTLPTGDIVLYENAVDDSSTAITTCGMKTTNIYKKNADGTVYKDPYTNRHVLESSTVIMPSGLSKVTSINKSYRMDDSGILKNIYTTTRQNGKLSKDKRDFERFRAWHVSSEGNKNTINFDIHNQNIVSTKPYGLYTTTYTYDDKGRVVQDKFGYRKTLYTYDSKGNLATLTDPSGKVTYYSYDLRDRLTTVTYPDNHTTHYAYDSNGNMTRLTTPTPTDHTFRYNGVNKKTSMTSPLQSATTYSYDKQRRVTKITKPSGKTINTNYGNGRVEGVVTPEGTTNYSYDCQSSVGNISKGRENFNFIYDGTLVTSIVQSGLLNHTISYIYNNDFIPSSMTYAGAGVSYVYNKDNELVRSGDFNVSRVSNYGIKKTVSDGTYTQLNDYNLYGELTEQVDGLFAVNLYRNKNGQITKKVETLDGNISSYTYRYDDKSRLTDVRLNRKLVEKYTYDANGNRLTATSKDRNITNQIQSYNADDQIQLINTLTQTYDVDGYLQTKVLPNGETYSFKYGTMGELREVGTPSKTITYKHNANNQRVSKEVNGTVVEKYLWLNLTTLLAVYDGADNLVQRFEYTDNRMPVAMTMNAQKYYLHYDQVGSLRAVSNTSHNIVKEITYDTYGNILTDTNSSLTVPFGFAGGLYDVDTKLTRFGYRDYDAYTGKWTAKDPIGFSGGDLNLYGYVLGDPVNFIDPIGLTPAPGMRRPFKDLKWYDGPFGPICGAEGSWQATWIIPDVTPNACQRHDDCYSDCSKTKQQCDLEFDKSNSLYAQAVWIFGQKAYDDAQKKNGCLCK